MKCVQCPMCGAPNRPIGEMSAGEVLALTANIPIGLANIVIQASEREGFAHDAIRKDGRTPAMLAVRDKIVRRALSRGYSVNQLGRALNRCHTSVRASIARQGL